MHVIILDIVPTVYYSPWYKQGLKSELYRGQECRLIHEPNNPHDSSAMRVMAIHRSGVGEVMIGYVPQSYNTNLLKYLQDGEIMIGAKLQLIKEDEGLVSCKLSLYVPTIMVLKEGDQKKIELVAKQLRHMGLYVHQSPDAFTVRICQADVLLWQRGGGIPPQSYYKIQEGITLTWKEV
jgi:hypothetical protein